MTTFRLFSRLSKHMTQKTILETKVPYQKHYATPSLAPVNGSYLLTGTIYVDSTVDSPLLIAATGGLDVDAIPNEITTRIILNPSKSTILAQAINIGAKGVQ